MPKEWLRLILSLFLALIFDQIVKYGIVFHGLRYEGEFFSIILTFNKGVAFSMLSSLGPWLKYLQILLLCMIVLYLIFNKSLVSLHGMAFGIIIGSGVSNLFDRFYHGGVVDYIFWHKWFEFAVFNLADAMINLAVAMILYRSIFKKELS
ncbi:MAG: signal peptidase II [Sulfurospirillaceae bacterium]|nr:signal peptidase II [Sulfurospirillaceae bacterium]MDY0238710.1 signal peptidase II [Campylobacterales bacterium]